MGVILGPLRGEREKCCLRKRVERDSVHVCVCMGCASMALLCSFGIGTALVEKTSGLLRPFGSPLSHFCPVLLLGVAKNHRETFEHHRGGSGTTTKSRTALVWGSPRRCFEGKRLLVLFPRSYTLPVHWGSERGSLFRGAELSPLGLAHASSPLLISLRGSQNGVPWSISMCACVCFAHAALGIGTAWCGRLRVFCPFGLCCHLDGPERLVPTPLDREDPRSSAALSSPVSSLKLRFSRSYPL